MVGKGGKKLATQEFGAHCQTGHVKVELKCTVVTVISTKAACVGETCRIDGQRKLLSFDIQIIFRYSNKKLVLYSPSGFLSTTGLFILPFPQPLVSPPPLSMFHVLFLGKYNLRGILTLMGRVCVDMHSAVRTIPSVFLFVP